MKKIKCEDCKKEVDYLTHCSHCLKWICSNCGWNKHSHKWWGEIYDMRHINYGINTKFYKDNKLIEKIEHII